MKLLSVFFILFIYFVSFAQNEQTDTIGTDIYNATYTLKDNTVFKKNNEISESYRNFNFGDITTVDILNPFEIVVFYGEFNSAVILDNELNLKHTIRFANNISFVRKGITNKIWIYNSDENKVQLYDFKSNTISISSQILRDFTPVKMESDFNNVKLISKEKTFVFNQYLYLQDTIIH
ncbi:MAG: hypothetical protein KAH07_01010 [Flavobacteriaceae bacterium]|nr:hypothetical protein [Flavobacteriaceae bacterium]